MQSCRLPAISRQRSLLSRVKSKENAHRRRSRNKESVSTFVFFLPRTSRWRFRAVPLQIRSWDDELNNKWHDKKSEVADEQFKHLLGISRWPLPPDHRLTYLADHFRIRTEPSTKSQICWGATERDTQIKCFYKLH